MSTHGAASPEHPVSLRSVGIDLGRHIEAGPLRMYSVRTQKRGPDRLGSISGPFVQVNREQKQPQDGVGLGLTISRDLAATWVGTSPSRARQRSAAPSR